jgi:hypothetical protein
MGAAEKRFEELGLYGAKKKIDLATAKPEKPEKTLEAIEAEAEARARGGRKGAPPVDKGDGGLSPAGENTFLGRAGREWDKATEVNRSLSRQVRVMESGLKAAGAGDLAAGSQAVLVTFQKILDPTSVVRESEYARSAQGQALLARMEGALEQIKAGGAGVPLSELKKYSALAREIATSASGYEKTVRSRLTKQAGRFGVDPTLIFGDEEPSEALPAAEAAAAPAVTAPTGRQRAVNPQTKEVVEWDGTAWRPVKP